MATSAEPEASKPLGTRSRSRLPAPCATRVLSEKRTMGVYASRDRSTRNLVCESSGLDPYPLRPLAQRVPRSGDKRANHARIRAFFAQMCALFARFSHCSRHENEPCRYALSDGQPRLASGPFISIPSPLEIRIDASNIAVIGAGWRLSSVNGRLPAALGLPAPTHRPLGWMPTWDPRLDKHATGAAIRASVAKRRGATKRSNAVVFVQSAHDCSISGFMNNAIDQGSRPIRRSEWNSKPAGFVSVSVRLALRRTTAQRPLPNMRACLDMPAMMQPGLDPQYKESLVKAGGQIPAGARTRDEVNCFTDPAALPLTSQVLP